MLCSTLFSFYLEKLVLQQLTCRGALAGILDQALAHNVSHGLYSVTKYANQYQFDMLQHCCRDPSNMHSRHNRHAALSTLWEAAAML